MTREEIISGLKFTVEMFLFDPSTGETFTEPRNDMDKTTIDACRGAIELLEQEPSGDVISRQAVLDTISELNAISFYEAQEDSKDCYYEIRNAIDNLPSVNPQPCDDAIRAEIEQKCDRINSLASVLPYTTHREIQELLCEIMDLCKAESEDKE